MGILNFLKPYMPQLPQGNQNTQAITPNQNQRPRMGGGGILGAIGYGLSPQAFMAGQTNMQNRRVGSAANQEEAIRLAAQYGRYDLIEQIREQERARQEAQYRQGLGNIFNNQPQQSIQPQIMGTPIIPNQPQAQPMPQTNQGGFTDNGTSGDVVVTGARGQEIRQPIQPRDYNAEAVRYEQAAMLARQTGELEDAQRFQTQAETLRNRPNQDVAAQLSGLLSVQNDNEAFIANLDRLLEDARMQGIEIPQEVRQGLYDPQTRGAILSAAINRANPQDAVKEAINTAGTYQQFRPYQTDNLGGTQGVFDPRTGRYVSQQPKSIDPNTRANIASRERIARANRQLQVYITKVREKIARGQLSVAQGNLAIRQRQLELGLPMDAEAGSNDIMWDN